MGSHRISFQLQGGGTFTEPYDRYEGCSKRDAKYLLDKLEKQGERELKSDSDRRKLSEAIREAKGWIDRAHNMDSSGQSHTVAKFIAENGARCRIDIHIHSGAGHFSH